MPDSCACDACDTGLPPLDGDGFCSHCDEACFPEATFAGRKVRLALTAESRAKLHAIQRGAAVSEEDEPPPPPPPSSKEPLTDMASVARAVRRQAVEAAVDVARPMAEQALNAAFRLVKKRLGGR